MTIIPVRGRSGSFWRHAFPEFCRDAVTLAVAHLRDDDSGWANFLKLLQYFLSLERPLPRAHVAGGARKGRGSRRRPFAMTRSAGVLPRIAKAVIVAAPLKKRAASRLTDSTPQQVLTARHGAVEGTCGRTEFPQEPAKHVHVTYKTVDRLVRIGPAICLHRFSARSKYPEGSVYSSLETPARGRSRARRAAGG